MLWGHSLLPSSNIHLKVRKQQKGKKQYEKLNAQKEFFVVHEGGHQFYVNFRDYLDTGLFLDHRTTRQLIQKMASGKTFLNLFSYTGSVSVYAARGGASETTTVDMSHTYLNWAKRNFSLNEIPLDAHSFHQGDCFEWLKQCQNKYDLIFLDPPTFSASKRMKSSLDIQRDHVKLIKLAAECLSPEGTLVFSNNLRSFEMDFTGIKPLLVENWSSKTLPKDFERNPKIHNCWKITGSVKRRRISHRTNSEAF